jgi:hypothetical protein
VRPSCRPAAGLLRYRQDTGSTEAVFPHALSSLQVATRRRHGAYAGGWHEAVSATAMFSQAHPLTASEKQPCALRLRAIPRDGWPKTSEN